MTEPYQPGKLETDVYHLIEIAQEGRIAKGDANPTVIENLVHFVKGYKARREVLLTLQRQLKETEPSVAEAERTLKAKVNDALKTYAGEEQFNIRAVYAKRQFQQNIRQVYDSISNGTFDGDEVKRAFVHVSNDVLKGTANDYASLEAYVATIPASDGVRKLFLPPQQPRSRRYLPFATAFLAGATAMSGIDYLLDSQIKKQDSINIPRVVLKNPATKESEPEPIRLPPTRKNVREYLDDHPDLLGELCPACDPCPDCPELPAPIVPALPSATLSQSPQPSSTLGTTPLTSTFWEDVPVRTRRSRVE